MKDVMVVSEIANMLTEQGIPYSVAWGRIKNFTKDDFIVSIKQHGKTSSRLYGQREAAVAWVLSGLVELGIADRELLSVASAALYSEQDFQFSTIHQWEFSIVVLRCELGFKKYKFDLIRCSGKLSKTVVIHLAAHLP